MIVFCEDCGRKNSVGPDAIKDGMLDFHCCVCRYHNRYSHNHKPSPDPFSQLTRFLNSLSSQKAVKGYFIFHPSQGVLHHRMPSSLKAEDIFTMGRSLTESYRVSEKLFSDIKDMKITLSKHDIRIFHICNQMFFILVMDCFGFDGSFKKYLTDHLPLFKQFILNKNEFHSLSSKGQRH